jgi:hypothetical protein
MRAIPRGLILPRGTRLPPPRRLPRRPSLPRARCLLERPCAHRNASATRCSRRSGISTRPPVPGRRFQAVGATRPVTLGRADKLLVVEAIDRWGGNVTVDGLPEGVTARTAEHRGSAVRCGLRFRAGRAAAASRSQSGPAVSGAARSGRSWRGRRQPTSGRRPPESRRRSVFRPPRCRRRQLDLRVERPVRMPVLSMPSRPSPSRRQPGQVVASSVPSPRSRTETVRDDPNRRILAVVQTRRNGPTGL